MEGYNIMKNVRCFPIHLLLVLLLITGNITSVSAVTEVNVTDASEESFICQSDDIIKVIK